MSVKTQRQSVIEAAIDEIRTIMAEGISIETLERAKRVLISLCERAELFPREDFPVPDGDLTERTFLLREDDDGALALYVNSGLPAQSYRPHNHGGAWAIVAAVEGSERHDLYTCEQEKLEHAGEVVVQPGTAVSMLPEGIHAIQGVGDQPLLHLHLYARNFANQAERIEFDPEAGTSHRFKLEDLGFVEDAR